MPGLAEGMEGVKAGETREIRVTFPDKLGPQGGDLEGTKAVFEVEAVEVQVQSSGGTAVALLVAFSRCQYCTVHRYSKNNNNKNSCVDLIPPSSTCVDPNPGLCVHIIGKV